MRYLIILLFLFSCANPYGKHNGLFGTGYKDTKISENKYRIIYQGNGYTSKSVLVDYNSRRSSELCPKGYSKLSEELELVGGLGGGAFAAMPELTTIIQCK
tara:strand:+ start:428 stop:730 length:303 start_codon:yes stop_codon:yes gene_type:complete